MYDLSRFSLSDMTRCGIELRKLGSDATSMEEVADRIVHTLFRQLRTPDLRDPACALVRMFVTMPYAELDEPEQQFVRGVLGGEPDAPTMKCLTLLGTAGEQERWNSRRQSEGHRALPLRSEESVARSPMIAQLIRQLGVEIGPLLSPRGDLVLDIDQHTYNVFHVPEAPGSPHIPAQREFVQPHQIRSVLGFGGLLPSRELYAIILFSKLAIPREVADLFKTLALNVKLPLLPFVGGRTFAS
jgi:hypothetical protein